MTRYPTPRAMKIPAVCHIGVDNSRICVVLARTHAPDGRRFRKKRYIWAPSLPVNSPPIEGPGDDWDGWRKARPIGSKCHAEGLPRKKRSIAIRPKNVCANLCPGPRGGTSNRPASTHFKLFCTTPPGIISRQDCRAQRSENHRIVDLPKKSFPGLVRGSIKHPNKY